MSTASVVTRKRKRETSIQLNPVLPNSVAPCTFPVPAKNGFPLLVSYFPATRACHPTGDSIALLDNADGQLRIQPITFVFSDHLLPKLPSAPIRPLQIRFLFLRNYEAPSHFKQLLQKGLLVTEKVLEVCLVIH
jgi:hypothetical protein